MKKVPRIIKIASQVKGIIAAVKDSPTLERKAEKLSKLELKLENLRKTLDTKTETLQKTYDLSMQIIQAKAYTAIDLIIEGLTSEQKEKLGISDYLTKEVSLLKEIQRQDRETLDEARLEISRESTKQRQIEQNIAEAKIRETHGQYAHHVQGILSYLAEKRTRVNRMPIAIYQDKKILPISEAFVRNYKRATKGLSEEKAKQTISQLIIKADREKITAIEAPNHSYLIRVMSTPPITYGNVNSSVLTVLGIEKKPKMERLEEFLSGLYHAMTTPKPVVSLQPAI